MESLGAIPGIEGGCLTVVIEKKDQTTLTEFHLQLTNKIQQADHRVDRETENIGTTPKTKAESKNDFLTSFSFVVNALALFLTSSHLS